MSGAPIDRRRAGPDAHRTEAADDQAARRSICARSPTAKAGRAIGCWRRCSSTRWPSARRAASTAIAPSRRLSPGQAAVELRLRRGAQRVQGPGDGAGRGPRVARSRRQRAAVRPAWRGQEPLDVRARPRADRRRAARAVHALQRARAAPAGGASRSAPAAASWPSSIASICSILDDLSYVRRDQAETSRAVRADRRALRAQEHRHHGQHAVLAMGRGVRRRRP